MAKKVNIKDIEIIVPTKDDIQNQIEDTSFTKGETTTAIGDHNTSPTAHSDIRGLINDLNTNKVEKIAGKGLSTNDYNNTQKGYVEGMINDNYFKGVSINETTYIITFTRRDNSTVQIDLPLESVVVSGSYNNTTKTIVLTLQNGSVVNIPVGDMVAGLMSTPSTQKGETANKTLTFGGTFKVLHVATNGTITERTMTMPAKPTYEYSDIGGTKPPTDAQKNVQSDWNAVSGDALVLNKPTLFSGSYTDLTNKPAIPTVPTISTDIDTDKNDNTKTTSPKSVYDFVESKIASAITEALGDDY